MIRRSADTLGAIVCSTLLSVACRPATTAKDGRVHIQFIAAMATEIHLRIQNGSPQPILLRGFRSSSGRIELWPDDLAVECRSSSAAVSIEEPFSISHDAVHPESISVASSDNLDLVVRKPMPADSKGTTCKVRLRLGNGSVIESTEFRY